MLIKELLQIVLRTDITPMIWGEHGLGKSSVVKQLAQSNGLEFIDLRLSQVEAGDLIGMPDRSQGKTVWLEPLWWPKPGTKGILFLDELNRAKEDVLQCVFQLVLDKELYTHKLPEQWKIVAACNPPDQYFVNELDPALMDRFIHLKFKNSKDDWTNYVSSKGDVHPAIIAFINANPSNLCKDLDYNLPIQPTPRSWDMLGVLFNVMSPQEINDYGVSLASGLIGSNLAVTLIKHIQGMLKSIPSGDKIMQGDYKKFWEEADHSVNGGILEYAIQNLLYYLKSDAYKYSTKTANNFVKFLLDIPSDFSTKVVKLLLVNQEHPTIKKLMNFINTTDNPDFTDFVHKIASLRLKGSTT